MLKQKHHALQDTSPCRIGVESGSLFHEIVAKLRNAMGIETAIGYQDEWGFHMGVKPVENKIKWPSVW